MYIAEGNIIYKQTQTKKSTVTYCHCMLKGITAEGAEITTTQTATITPQWQIFDTEQGKYVADPENSTPFEVEVAGQNVTVPVGESLEFESEEAGEYIINTANDSVNNMSVRVVVSNG